jgi:hypothetical protein
MKKVGILTFHYINNYGAILQAYALKKAIDKFDGYTAEIINYIPEDRVEYPYEYGDIGKKLVEGKLNKLYEFLWDYCDVKKDIVRSVEGNEYDYYCVGSDQVWNFVISGNDYTYLLKDVDLDAKKISFSSSFGLSVDKLMPYKEIYKRYLSGFKAVSVRESVHQKWLQESCGIECENVLDPTFLLNADEYEPIISEKNMMDHPYILFIWYMHDQNVLKGIEFVNTLSRKYRLPIKHNIVKARPWMIAHDDGCMFYEGVPEFLWYIKNAELVVTNSYHTTMFAIHFKKPFYTFVTESMRSRFDSIGAKMGIKDRYVDRYIVPGDLNMDMDYKKIEANLEEPRSLSRKFLKEALDINEK